MNIERKSRSENPFAQICSQGLSQNTFFMKFSEFTLSNTGWHLGILGAGSVKKYTLYKYKASSGLRIPLRKSAVKSWAKILFHHIFRIYLPAET